MPINIQKYIVIGLALLLSHTAIFYAGYFKKGEVEANKTTVAIAEAVEVEAETQADLIDIGLEQADKEIEIKVVTKVIEKEVIKNVKKFIIVDMCYSNDGVQRINQALGYSKSESNSKPISSLSGNWESGFWKIRGYANTSY